MGSKYHNRKTEVDGILFDSQAEARRYAELKLMQRAGEIGHLERQVPFEIIPKMKTKDGRTIRATKYVADFTYYTKGGQYVVEDVKGKKTAVYEIKKKLMLEKHCIEVHEIGGK